MKRRVVGEWPRPKTPCAKCGHRMDEHDEDLYCRIPECNCCDFTPDGDEGDED